MNTYIFDFKTLTQIHSNLMTNSLRGYKVQERNYVKEMADKISSTYWKAEIDLVQNVLLLAATIANKLGESDKRKKKVGIFPLIERPPPSKKWE